MTKNLRERIHEDNIAVHKFEAQYYELLHPEVYGRQEQQRITSTLKTIDKLIASNHKKALDFGAGTGNLTSKLLKMGYTVMAVDISPEMCAILKIRYKTFLDAGKLKVVNLPLENVDFEDEKFDLIACYSVLHHLPDYEGTLEMLSVLLKQGGAIYIDHEASPFYWENEPKLLADLLKSIYFHSNPMINALHFAIMGFRIVPVDYTYSDYWHKKEHPLDHSKVESTFEKAGFRLFKRIDYHLKGTWVPNPSFHLYKRFCRPEMSCWIAKK